MGELFAPFLAAAGVGLVQDFMNFDRAQSANALNYHMFKVQQQFQQQEAEINRQYQTSERLDQNQFVKDLYEKYQSPSAMVDQYRTAGLNPAALLAQSSAPVVGSSLGSSGSVSGAPSSGVSSSSLGTQSPYFVKALDSIGGFLNNLASAREKGANTSRIEKMTGLEVENQALKNKSVEIQNAITQTDLYVQRNIKDVRVRKAYSDLVESGTRALLNQSESDLNEWKSMSEQFSQKLTDAKTRLTEKEILDLGIRVDNLQRLIDADLELKRAQKTESYARAEESSSQAELARLQGEQVDSYTKILNNPWYRRNLVDQLTESVRGLRKANKISDKSLELLEQNIIKLQKANSTYEIQLYTHLINETLGTVGDLVGEFTRFGLAKKFLNNESKIEKLQGEFDTYKKKVEFDRYQFQP